jgi:hypothetical protein
MVADLMRDRADATRGRRLLRWTLWLGAVAALGFLLFGWFQGWFTTHPKVTAGRQAIGQQIAALEKAGAGQASLALDDRKYDALQKQVRALPKDLRQQLQGDLHRLSEARERAAVNSYFSLPPTQRQAEIDRRIQADVKAQQAKAAARAAKEKRTSQAAAKNAANQKNAGSQEAQARAARPGSSSATAAQGQGAATGSQRQAQAGNAAKSGGGQQNGARSDRPATQSPKTEETAALRRKQRLDNTDPQQRALRAEYKRLMDERRAQLGLATGKR